MIIYCVRFLIAVVNIGLRCVILLVRLSKQYILQGSMKGSPAKLVQDV